jgi:hypothetical protein
MNFWKKSKHPYKSERIVTEVSLPTLARWYAYDAGLEHPDEVADALGMLPTSEDGVKMEEQDSDRRTNRVIPLIPLIETIADINAQAIATLQMDHFMEDHGLDADELAHERIHIEEMYRQIGFSALLAGISAGIELGILETNAVGGGIIHGE